MPDSANSSPTPENITAFIARWSTSGGHERAAAQLFLTELCDLLGLPHADPPSKHNHENSYCFERAVPHTKNDGSTTTRFIDCYKRAHFVLETKQGINPDETQSEKEQLRLKLDDLQHVSTSLGHGKRGSASWDTAMEKAKNQAEGYIRDLPPEEGRPPFLIVCDVGHVFELYAEFSLTGGSYVRFPDPKSHRIFLEELADPEKRALLKTIWTDPLSLDPSKRAAAVTREIAHHLAALAKSLEADGHDPQEVAAFLQRCLFTMFAEDVGLLPHDGFLDLLRKVKDSPQGFPVLVTNLWNEMATGTEFSTVLLQKIAHFNGGLFEQPTALPLSSEQIALLIGATKPDWSNVEPAIFGTLLERALSKEERHKMGAHYTPRSYVERLVKPTIIDPLRQQWETIKAEAAQFQKQGKADKAIAAVHDFHHELCRIRILDPACGSGNFLYVTLEHMKRLEGEVIELLQQLGDSELTFEMEEFKVRPQQFLGIEINAHAVAIAQLVLWIGYFQWHKRATGSADTQDRPLIPKDKTIKEQDAVLAYDEEIPRKDADGNFVCIWDGRTTKPHSVTGEEVPDETATKPVYDYINPRRATWPEADYVVGNPPFIGDKKMVATLGSGYCEAFRSAWKGRMPESADFVLTWWYQAAELLREKKIKRFGFITTNSIHQTFNRRVLETFVNDSKKPISIAFAIPDHPWVNSADGASVRIAMTVADRGTKEAELKEVIAESSQQDSSGEFELSLSSCIGYISPKLAIGVDVTKATKLSHGRELNSNGMMLGVSQFKFDLETAKRLGYDPLSLRPHPFIKPIFNGNALKKGVTDEYALDLFGNSSEQIRGSYPALYQYVLTYIKPKRDTNNRKSLRERWWLFSEPRKRLRGAISGLERFIVTIETSKHRYFSFLETSNLPEHKLVCFGLNDAYYLSTLSCSIHTSWVTANQSKLGVGNDPVYVQTKCFETFPFPALEDGELKNRIRDLGEQLDAHRKDRQAEHADLTMTGMYNVLEKLRKEEPLTEKEKKIHADGLVSLLKQYHDQIDAAVLQAYGWTDLATSTPIADRLARGDEDLEQAILTRLVDLNHERAAEEKRGLIRYLRPEYQNPNYAAEAQHAAQSDLAIETPTEAATPKSKLVWPKTFREQIAQLKQLLPQTGPNVQALSAHFGRKAPAREAQIQDLLHTLSDLGQL